MVETHPIARSSQGSQQRFFPPITSELYSRITRKDRSPEGLTAAYLLSLPQELSTMQRYLVRKLSATEIVGRLLYFHKQALEAEMVGKWQRADYFWHAILDSCIVADKIDPIFAAAGTELYTRYKTEGLSEPRVLRKLLITEIFIDTHCAFYNGYLETTDQNKADLRAYAHLQYIVKWIKISNTDLLEMEISCLLKNSVDFQLNLLEKNQKVEEGLQLCEDLLQGFPENTDFQHWWARFFTNKTMSKLKKNKNRANNKHLKNSLKCAEKMLNDHPKGLAFYNVMGHLHHQRAIVLANSGQLAQAIVSAYKALTYSPSNVEAKKTLEMLTNNMVLLQAQVMQLQARLASRPRARLNAQGYRLVNEAKQGLKPLEKYKNSIEAKKTTVASLIAQGWQLWWDIGNPEPPTGGDETIQKLLVVVGGILAQKPVSPEQLATTWQITVEANPDFGQIDSARVLAFLQKRIFPENIQERGESALPQVTNPPLLRPLEIQRKRSGEPFSFWLFSPQDLRIKIQTGIAILLLVVVCGVLIREGTVRKIRTEAYDQVVSASEIGDHAHVIESAEQYFRNSPFARVDERDERVVDLYTRAFVRWYVGLNGELEDDDFEHIDRYQDFVLDSSGYEGNNR